MRVARAFLIAVVAMGIGAMGVAASDKAGEPETAAAYILKGQKLFAAKKLEECREAFEKAAELEPNNLIAKVGQCVILAQLGRPDDGLAVLDKWIEAKPEDPQRWGAKFHAAAGIGRPKIALEAANKLIQLEPAKNHGVGRGQMLMALDRNEEALEAFDKAIVMVPKHEAAWANRGETLVRLGKYDEAIRSCGKAIELSPKWADPWYSRAKAHARRADTTKALSDLKKAIELQPALKSKALKAPDFKSLYNNAEFKSLTKQERVSPKQ